ncbi:MAG: VIT1/CCC1 transporter family protein [Steroidobacteraceae bacterium]
MSREIADSWLHEKESAWLYHRVAAAEPDLHHRRLFEQLAEAAEEQAQRWQDSAQRGGTTAELVFRPSTRARVVARLVRWLGPRALRSVLAAMKLRGLSVYSGPAVSGHEMPTTLAEVGARHRGGLGGNLRATVFGINDGLLANASLVMGMAGAGGPPTLVWVTGVAGLLAGALSMAAGEYVSVRSQREMYEYQIALERAEIAEYPQEEAEELALIYAARGMPLAQAREVSQTLLARPEHALDVLAREELGLSPELLGSPWGAAGSSFLAFAVGAAVPLMPFLAGAAGVVAVVAAAALTAATLFVVGLAISLFTGRHALRGALRMVLIGSATGLLTYLLGRSLGAVLH